MVAPHETERVRVDANGLDREAVQVALRWAVEFARRNGFARAGVVVSGLRQVDSLAGLLGVDAHTLREQRQIQLGDVTLDVIIEPRLPYSYEDGPVVGLWVDAKQLDKLDALRTPAICAVPWSRSDIDGWNAAWDPRDLRSGAGGGGAEVIDNPVVVRALRDLTHSVNLGTGLGHPSDRDSAIGLFSALHDAEEHFDPEEIRAWAVRNGWDGAHARDLADIARKVREGRRLQTRNRQMWRDDIVELWRDEPEDE